MITIWNNKQKKKSNIKKSFSQLKKKNYLVITSFKTLFSANFNPLFFFKCYEGYELFFRITGSFLMTSFVHTSTFAVKLTANFIYELTCIFGFVKF